MNRIPNLVTGVTARLPGDLARHDSATPAGGAWMAASIWTLRIPGWMPTSLNKLVGGHWATGHRAKKRDKQVIGDALLAYRVPTAKRKRRVSLLVVLPKGKRAIDPDNAHKSLLDALVTHGALRNDSRLWVESVPVQFARGPELVSFLTLEDSQ